MKRARIVWTVVFLGVTLAAIVMEVVAGVFRPAGTIPWTEYIARYVPWPVQLAAYVVLAVWLPFHFWRHDHLRKAAYEKGYRTARLDLMMERVMEDLATTGLVKPYRPGGPDATFIRAADGEEVRLAYDTTPLRRPDEEYGIWMPSDGG